MISNGKKAVIHIAKSQVGMTDDEYSSLLSSVGVESCVDLNNKTFALVMKSFEKLGFKTKFKKQRHKGRKAQGLPRSKQQLMKKLGAIILDLNLTWNYVDAIAKKRFEVDAAQWLETDDLYKLVQMMVIHQKRKRRA